ncbi:MAG: hypothetical protein OEO77_02195 [Acidimicrobiia bacterium]|nr:hypothetical protein [Acidimicrobiia bacterium]
MRIRSIFIAFAALGVLIGACSIGARPDFGAWEPEWAALTAGLPTEAELASGGEDVCSAALVTLREQRTVIVPTPEEALDPPVEAWFSLAEDTFFDCPPNVGFEAAYAEMAAFEDEVAAVLNGR